MTDDEIIEVVAELDGWKKDQYGNWRCGALAPEHSGELPAYLTSRDAIVPVIEKQALLIRSYFLDIIAGMVREQHKNTCLGVMFATPSQLCEALLRATCKWKE